jgi:hypothetical protein
VILIAAEDIYSILGIQRDSSAASVTAAYRKAALRLHPDKSTGSEERFKSLSAAYRAWQDGVSAPGSIIQDRMNRMKRDGGTSYAIWATTSGLATVTASDLLKDYSGFFFTAESGMCMWDSKSPTCLSTQCPPGFDKIRRSQGWNEPYEGFGGPCLSPYGGKLLCCRAADGDKSWGGTWQSTITGRSAHCSYWLDPEKLGNTTVVDSSAPYCGELDCNLGTTRFVALITGSDLITRSSVKCNVVVFSLNSTDIAW